MWHINNEYCTVDYGDEAAAAFRRWLRDRYGTLDALNTAWGTAFWSQGYDAWDEILPPRHAHYMKNPAQVLDFKRFTSDMLLECYAAERDIVAPPHPAHPGDHQLHAAVGRPGRLARGPAEEDVVSVDIYPDPRDPLGAQQRRARPGHDALAGRRRPLDAHGTGGRSGQLARGQPPQAARA